MANKKISELTTRTPSLSDLILVGDPSNGFSYKCTVTALATIIETDISDGYVTLGTTQTISGAKTFSNNLTLTSVANATTDPDKFLVLNGSNVVNYRTGSEVLSDIGGQATISLTTTGTSGAATFTSNTLNIPQYQGAITLTTTGTSGAATLVGNTLNIPNYAPDLSGYVPTSRTITINGTTQDLSANRTYNVGTVTSVAASAGTGISISGSPITSSGTITITNTAPDQVVALTAGTGISISGTYPNFTITNSSPSLGGTVTSVALSAPTGFAVTGSPITSSGTLALAFDTGYSLPTTASQTNWDSAYNNMIVSAAVTGTTTKTLTLTQQDAGTITASWTDDNTDAVTSVFGRTGAVVATEGDYSLTQLSDVTITSPTTGQVLKYNGTIWVNDTDANTGTVTSVALSAPTGFSVSGSPITSSGTLALSFASGYSLPTNTSQSNWDTAYTNRITSLTTTGSSGSATLISNTLNIPTYTLAGLGGISLTSLSASAPLSYNNTTGAFSISQSNTTTDGYLSATDWNTFNNKQATITLTTTGTSGAATFTSNTLNIPQYQGALTLTTTGTSGAATLVGNTLNIPQYSGGGGTVSGTTNYIAKFTSSTAVGDSRLFDDGTITFLGNGDVNATPSTGIFSGTGGTGTNIAGAELRLRGGASTGNAAGGIISFYTSDAGTAGTGVNAATEKMRLDGTGSLQVIGNITANNFIPTGSGVPVNGLYLAAANSIGFATNTTPRMRIDASGNVGIGTATIGSTLQVNGNAAIGYSASTAAPTNGLAVSGNVGIGTTSPSTPLHVVGGTIWSSNFYEIGRFQKSSGTGVSLGYDNTAYVATIGAYSHDGTASNLAFWTYPGSGSLLERMRITSGGLIGIGTTTIGSRLQVNGNAAIGYSSSTAAPTNGLAVAGQSTFNDDVAIRQSDANTTSYFASPRLLIQNTSATVGNFENISFLAANGDDVAAIWAINTVHTATASTGQLVFGTTNAGAFSVERMRITSGGNVGIGTTSPETLLHINSSVAGGEGGYIYIDNPAASTLGNKAGIKFGSSGGATFSSFPTGEITNIVTNAVNGASALTFGTFNGSASGERMRLASDGSLGIGTTTIGSRLQVNGNAAIGYSASTAAPTNGLAVSGNVGIGTTSPNTILEANQSTNSDAAIRITNSNAGSSATAQFFANNGTNQTQFFHTGTAYNIGGSQVINYANLGGIFNTSTGIALSAAGASGIILFGTGSSQTERMRITSGGQVTLSTGANVSAIAQTGYSLTGSNAQSLIDLAGTWNTTGNPTAIKLNITNTASGASAYLMDLQVGGATQFRVTKAGAIRTAAPSGGTANDWKLGSLVTGTVCGTTNDWLEVEVGGTVYKLALALTSC